MIRKITIHPVLNGFLVHVGCQTLVFNGRPHQMLEELMAYLTDPERTEKRFRAESINNWMLKDSLPGIPANERGIGREEPMVIDPQCCGQQQMGTTSMVGTISGGTASIQSR